MLVTPYLLDDQSQIACLQRKRRAAVTTEEAAEPGRKERSRKSFRLSHCSATYPDPWSLPEAFVVAFLSAFIFGGVRSCDPSGPRALLTDDVTNYRLSKSARLFY
jgi:hypothetical protein